MFTQAIVRQSVWLAGWLAYLSALSVLHVFARSILAIVSFDR